MRGTGPQRRQRFGGAGVLHFFRAQNGSRPNASAVPGLGSSGEIRLGRDPMPIQPTAQKLRVLVADGYADAADSLALLVTLWGHDPMVARTGPETLATAARWRPHVVFLELLLDGIDGYEVAKHLRRQAREPFLLIALTGFGDPAHRRRCDEEGFDHHLLKPVEPTRLQKLLEKFTPP
jgi:CheY-like chemotaxis protein